jgi:hypothetical protein
LVEIAVISAGAKNATIDESPRIDCAVAVVGPVFGIRDGEADSVAFGQRIRGR